jgi:hypothetical protein
LVTSDSSDGSADSDDVNEPDDDGDHLQHGDGGQWFDDSGQPDEEDSHDPEGFRHDEDDHDSGDREMIGPDETHQDRDADSQEQDNVSHHDAPDNNSSSGSFTVNADAEPESKWMIANSPSPGRNQIFLQMHICTWMCC